MKRKLTTIVTLAVLVLSLATLALAEGNSRKGKFLYRKNCRSCHGASASDLSPMTKTQAEWKALEGKTAGIPCHDKWPAMSAEDLADIFSYLVEGAKDSPTPAKCS